MAFVDYTKKGNIAIITLNRPDRLNSLGRVITDGIEDACKKLEKDNEVRVAILTGTGRAFCAGADVKEFGQPLIYPEAFDIIGAVKKPVIAAVNGYALGGGCFLMISCDIRIAAESATFAMPEVNFVIPVGPEKLLAQGVPSCVAMELILTGERISAQRAYEIGLINKVVSDNELMNETIKMAEKIASHSPLVLRLDKEAGIRAIELSEADKEKAQERRVLARQSEDFQEAVDAFIEKRKPDFKGK